MVRVVDTFRCVTYKTSYNIGCNKMVYFFCLEARKMALFKVPELTEQMRSPGVGLVMRALEDADFDKGFLALLSQVSLLFRRATTTTATVLSKHEYRVIFA